MESYILGLDLGTTSIGSGAIQLDKDQKPTEILHVGSRIFREMVDADSRETKNKTRRTKRLMRRQYARTRERRDELRSLLAQHGLLPQTLAANAGEQACEFNKLGDPLLLRVRALREPLPPEALGRIILHLHKHRGYWHSAQAKLARLANDPRFSHLMDKATDESDPAQTSNEGEQIKSTEKEEKRVVLGGIEKLQERLNGRTLGQFLVETFGLEKAGSDMPRRVTKQQIKGITLYAKREHYEREFDDIWTMQSSYEQHRLILTDELKHRIHAVLFRQLPLKSQRDKIGKCSLEPDERRAPAASLLVERCRILQDLNNVFIKLPEITSAHGLPPTAEQREAWKMEHRHLIDELETRDFIKWAELRERCGLPRRIKLNFENVETKKGLVGNRTAIKLRAIAPEWDRFANETVFYGKQEVPKRDALVGELLGNTGILDKSVLFRRLVNANDSERNPWRFDEKTALKLATVDLLDGYSKHSLKAWQKIYPHLLSGKPYDKAVTAAGYKFSDQSVRKVYDLLPPPEDIANPLVQKALHEVRKVVKALITEHGKPMLFRVELARDMKSSKAHRREIEKQQAENQKRNKTAIEEILKNKKHVTKENIDKYKLWKEAGCRSAYADDGDQDIGIEELFTEQIEVDHIWPRSRFGDDSYMNKTICRRGENQEKGDRSPHKWLEGTDRLRIICERLGKLIDFPKKKLTRIRDKPPEDPDFIGRQLSDTRYICTKVMDYLKQLGVPVEVTTGRATSEIAHLWGLKKFLSPENTLRDWGSVASEDEPTEQEMQPESQETKKRAPKQRIDHRHHAVDAVVTALTDRSRYADLQARWRHKERTGQWPDARLPEPWQGFAETLRNKISEMIVSHEPMHRLRGRLHEETAFSKRHYSLKPAKLGAGGEKSVGIKLVRRMSGNGQQQMVLQVHKPSGWVDLARKAGHGVWISDTRLSEPFWQWFDNYPQALAKPDDHPPLLVDGNVVRDLPLSAHCFVVRQPLANSLGAIDKESGKGKKSGWIYRDSTRVVLRKWLSNHAKPKEAIKRGVWPIIGKHQVRSVMVAFEADDAAIVQIGHKYFAAEGYHHVEIFRRPIAQQEGKWERQARFVRRLDAIRRQRQHVPIYNQTPEPEWGEDWQFEMWLANNDLVRWSDGNIYRVQKMSDPNIIFRPYFVNSSDDKDKPPLILRRGVNTLDCVKIAVDVLGRIRTQS